MNTLVPFYLDQSPQPTEAILELKFRELLLTLFNDPENMTFLGHVARYCYTDKIDLREVMEQNYMYNLSMDEYAKIAGRSLAAFKREFNELFNDTPGKWLMNKKIHYAESLLMTTSKSVGDISFESGFRSNTHFIRVFKETFGFPPLRYKKQNRLSLANS